MSHLNFPAKNNGENAENETFYSNFQTLCACSCVLAQKVIQISNLIWQEPRNIFYTNFFIVKMRHFGVIFKQCDYFDHFEYNGDAPEIVSYPFV